MSGGSRTTLLAHLASESLSRVDCQFCGGRLYTHHRPGCPVPAAAEKRNAELLAAMTKAMNDAA